MIILELITGVCAIKVDMKKVKKKGENLSDDITYEKKKRVFNKTCITFNYSMVKIKGQNGESNDLPPGLKNWMN